MIKTRILASLIRKKETNKTFAGGRGLKYKKREKSNRQTVNYEREKKIYIYP